jgi:hypothetical protein
LGWGGRGQEVVQQVGEALWLLDVRKVTGVVEDFQAAVR